MVVYSSTSGPKGFIVFLVNTKHLNSMKLLFLFTLLALITLAGPFYACQNYAKRYFQLHQLGLYI